MISEQIRPALITLVVADAVGSTDQYQLQPDHGVFLGTSPNCGVSLSGAGVSDMHSYVKFENGKLWIEDWMSKTGTLVNGVPISTRVEVNSGDIIHVGPNKIVLESAVRSQPIAEPRLDPACDESSDCDEPSLNHESAVTGFDSSFFEIDDLQTYDAETVSLLRAEIDHLQAALARRDAEQTRDAQDESFTAALVSEDADSTLLRIQELIDEANHSDERAALLEEMLHAAEDANRSEQEERRQLEAWVGDIERRIGQREDEHQAEIESLRQRLDESNQAQERLVQQLRQAAGSSAAPTHYQEHFEKLQHSHRKLQDELAHSQKQCNLLQQRLEHASEEPERALREERAKIAKEHAKVARLRYEVSAKLAAFEDLPKTENLRDTEAAHRIKVLREHLREIHEQEKKEEKSATLATRLSRLWQRVEY